MRRKEDVRASRDREETIWYLPKSGQVAKIMLKLARVVGEIAMPHADFSMASVRLDQSKPCCGVDLLTGRAALDHDIE